MHHRLLARGFTHYPATTERSAGCTYRTRRVLFSRVPVEAEVLRSDVLSEIGARLDDVLKHSLNSALLGRIPKEVAPRQRLLLLFQFTVALFDLFELD